jgi:predicted DNA-binding protein (MmcQ/YjbR family)
MHLDSLRRYCLVKPEATEDLPFGPDVLAFRVAGKIFALANLERVPPAVNLKCDPERAVDLRERYADVRPGYHMDKRHWNTVGLRGDVPGALVRDLVDHSYALVVAGLPRADRQRLAEGVSGDSSSDP